MNDITSRYTPGGSEITTQGLSPGLLGGSGLGGFNEDAFFRMLAERKARQDRLDEAAQQERDRQYALQQDDEARKAAAFGAGMKQSRLDADRPTEAGVSAAEKLRQKMRQEAKADADEARNREQLALNEMTNAQRFGVQLQNSSVAMGYKPRGGG